MGSKSADKPPFNRLTPHLASKAHWGVPEDGWRQVPSETAGRLSLLCGCVERGRVLIRALHPSQRRLQQDNAAFSLSKQQASPSDLCHRQCVSLRRWHMRAHTLTNNKAEEDPCLIVFLLCKCLLFECSVYILLCIHRLICGVGCPQPDGSHKHTHLYLFQAVIILCPF